MIHRTARGLVLLSALVLHVGCGEDRPSPAGAVSTGSGGVGAGGSSSAGTSSGPGLVGAGGDDLETGGGASTGGAGPDPFDCSGLPVCDDFESNAPGTTPAGWNVVLYPDGAGTVTVDETHAHSGSRAVRLVSVLPQTVSYVQIQHSMDLTDGFFGRMMLWATSTPTSPQHWNLIQGWGYLAGTTDFGLEDQAMYEYGGGGEDRALAAYYLNWTTDCFQSSTSSLPLGRWACVEWEFDGVDDQMRFWLDGQAIDDLTVTEPWCGLHWEAPIFERVDLGWYNAWAEETGPMEMWIDDVVVGPTRIGCPE